MTSYTAEQIDVLEDIEHIRTRPGMYIQDKGKAALPLKPKRRRPTLAYVRALERRVFELRFAIERMRERAPAGKGGKT